MSRPRGSVRMGPISLFTLVIVLCLAVLGVLAITTAQATFAAAEKQALFTTDTYMNETAAQEFVAEVDAALASVREEGGDYAEAREAVQEILPADATFENATVSVTFTADSGRILDVQLTIRQDATYEITTWKATTEWTNTDSGETLWSGGSETREETR